MIRSAFLSFYRSLTRHPLYSSLNLLGLSFGIAVFIVLSLFIRFETSYEQWLPNADRIYEIVHWNSPKSPLFYAAPGYVLDAIHENNRDLKATRLYPAYPVVRRGNAVYNEAGQLVDPDFFRMFDLPVVAGDPNAALASSDGLILSESMARKYFDETNVLGETLDLRDDVIGNGQPGKRRSWHVMAVIKDMPANSTLKLDIVRGLPAFRARIGEPYLWYEWGKGQFGRIFLELQPAEVSSALPSRLWTTIMAFPTPFSERIRARVHAHVRIGIAPFRGEHLSDPHLGQALSGLTATAWLTLVVAMVNYVNLATARTGLRLREVAVRNAHGASIREIGGQLLIEALLAGGVSLIIAFSFVEVSLPFLKWVEIYSLNFDYHKDWGEVLGLSSAVLASALLAGFYPAGVVAFSPTAQVFGASKAPGNRLRGRRLREGLSVVQFAIAGGFLIVIAGFAVQIRHMETSELGYSRDNLLITDALISSETFRDQIREVVAAWRSTPGIEGVTSGQAPGEYYLIPYLTFRRANRPGPAVEIGWNDVSADYFKVYRTRILAGRAVDDRDDGAPVHHWMMTGEDMEKGTAINVDIDATAAKALGFRNAVEAIGQDLVQGAIIAHIVGVVADQRFQGPMKKKGPTLYSVTVTAMQEEETVIRFAGIDEAAARRRLEAVWHEKIHDLAFDAQSIGQKLNFYYGHDRRNTRLFAIGGGVAALIGAVGLFGMAAFSASARVHEIGIRKTMGASRWRIIRLLVFQFLRPVLIANIIAWPIAYLVLDAWLKQFDDRVAMSPLFFLAGSGVSILIAAVTVVGVAVSAAGLTPARALRQI